MAKKTTTTKSSSSAANVEVPSAVPQEDTATMTGAPVAVSGAAGLSGPAAINTPESASESTSEGSGNPAAPAPAGVIEGDSNTGPAEGDGSTSSDATHGHDQIEAGTATASFTSAEPSQDAAAGRVVGVVHALLIAAGAASVEQLLDWADLGQRLERIAVLNGVGLDDLIARIRLTEDASGHESLADAMNGRNTGAIRVRAIRDGYRRAGVAHSKEGHTFEAGALTVSQVAAFIDDPSLTVEYI
ncbi:MAG: hypothetical protein DI537_20585 [Stutzerimonas stutzeri]|nr:MAG: hypothetical protein DI537_20585 [Stutzerimonas stutzeri]